MSDEQLGHIAEYSTAFTFTDSDRQIENDSYSDGHYVSRQRSMQRRNRAIKHDKQWRDSVQERSVLRYTTGG